MFIFLAKIPIQDIGHILEQITHVLENLKYILDIFIFFFGPIIGLYIFIGLITGIPVILLSYYLIQNFR
jgi:hypothetical protein